MPVTDTSRRIDPADIERAEALNIADLARGRGLILKRVGGELVGGCPHCGGVDRFAIHTAKQLFNCRGVCGGRGRGPIAFVQWLDGVGFRGAVGVLIGLHILPAGPPVNLGPAMPAPTAADHDRRQHDKARWLWSQRQPISGTIAEKYLREVRGITCALPLTLAFLPQGKPEHHPAMICAFGICDEIEPGIVAVPRDVVAVHLTLLKPDGTGKAEAEPNKLMIASPSGKPITIAPPNDLLGLAICEGIEDALSVHQALGLGAWAAGSAPHMGKLGDAVHDWLDCVSIFTDTDADHQGERNAALLADRLSVRGIFAEILPLAEALA